MRRILLLFLLLFLPLSGVVQAQTKTKTVSGVVLSSEDNLPIIGASVIVEGTKTGVVTDAQGHFQLKVSAERQSQLMVSFIGMKTISVVASGTDLRIVLRPTATDLNEVVTVGYSKSTKRSFTGSATTVKADALERKSVSSVSQALAAEVPGVTVINSSGQPGSAATIYVRGVGSVNASTAPLYVVDGIPFDGDITSINPADIESTTLLKDAASSAIYGARAANGVIVITTKQGKSGSFRVNADVKYGVNMDWLPRYSVITNPDEYLELSWESVRNRFKIGGATDQKANTKASENLFLTIGDQYNYYNVDPDKVIDPNTGKIAQGLTRKYTPENWYDEMINSSSRTEANVSLSGGTNKLRVFSSIGYLNDKGVAKNTTFQRLSGRINVDINPYPWLSTTARLNYSRSELNDPGQESNDTNIFKIAISAPPIYPIYLYDKEGNRKRSPYYDTYEYDFGESRGFHKSQNSIGSSLFNKNIHLKNQVGYNLGLTIRFLDGFSLENTLGGNYSNEAQKEIESKIYGTAKENGGYIQQEREEINAYNLLSLLRYSNKIKQHSFEVFVAHEANSYSLDHIAASKKGLLEHSNTSLDNAIALLLLPTGVEHKITLESYFAQANYDYQGKYFVSGTYRRDGSSKFLNNKWGSFGSVGLAWVASEEPFFSPLRKIVPFFKLKTSYGTLGQQSGLEYPDGKNNYYVGRRQYKIKNVEGKVGIDLYSIDDPNISWEKATMFQIGAEFQIGRFLTANVEYYNKRSSDLIYEQRQSPSRGYAIKLVNDGVLVNRGVDVDLTAHLLRGRDYHFNLRLNAGFLSNKMVTMPIDPSTGKPKHIDTSFSDFGRQAGRSLYDYYMEEFVGVDRETGLSKWVQYYDDANGNGTRETNENIIEDYVDYLYKNPNAKVVKTTTTKYKDATKNYVGKSALPTVRGGFSLSASYKGIELDLLFAYSLGGYAYDGSYAYLMHNNKAGTLNWHTDIRNHWTPENKDTDIPRLSDGLDSDVNSKSTRFLISSNYLSLSNVRLGYNLPTHWIAPLLIKGARLWVSADNLAILTARKGYNPSQSNIGESSTYNYAPMSTITGGISINF